MKKLALILCSLTLACGAFAQGTVVFNNSGSTLVTTNGSSIGQGTGSTTATAGLYYFALLDIAGVNTVNLAQPATNTASILAGTWTFSGVIGTNTAALGRMSSGPLSGEATAGSAGFQAGSSNWLMAVGWSANNGTSWAVVSNELATGTLSGYFGLSVAGFTTAGGVDPNTGLTVIPVSIFGINPGQLPNLTLLATPVPEPSTFALAGLGAAALMIFRRRKQ